jgi:2-isopropylmalate synthase
LFGNGERTGNVDVINIAMNMFTQGIDPGLDCSNIDALVKVAEYCNQLPVHPRHPYAGELVFTAFSGSHQDAINKGFKAMQASNSKEWAVPYLPIDPADLGRSYEAVIRINSQSGKGGIAYLLEQDRGLHLPRGLQVEFGKVVQAETDKSGAEITSDGLWRTFTREYLEQEDGIAFVDHRTVPDRTASRRKLDATVRIDGKVRRIAGHGTGPIDAYVDALGAATGTVFTVVDYREHAVGAGADAAAVAYVEARTKDGRTLFGVGMDTNIVTASLRAVTSAVNRMRRDG